MLNLHALVRPAVRMGWSAGGDAAVSQLPVGADLGCTVATDPQPVVTVLENVTGLSSIHDGKLMAFITTKLEEELAATTATKTRSNVTQTRHRAGHDIDLALSLLVGHIEELNQRLVVTVLLEHFGALQRRGHGRPKALPRGSS